MTRTEIEQQKIEIDQLTHEQMATIYRHSPSGHPWFDSTLPLNDYFMERFNSFGGMTPAISKTIGWKR